MATIDTIATRPTGTNIPAGKIYFETSTNKLIVHTGIGWAELDSDGTGSYGGPFIKYTINSSGGDFTIRSTSAVSYDVDWGDGSSESSTLADLTHTYASAGSYTINIATTGLYRPHFQGHSSDLSQLTSVEIDDGITLAPSLEQSFEYSNITDFTAPNATSNVTTLYKTFKNCVNLTGVEMDTSSVTSFRNAFQVCTSLTSFPELDFSSATGTTAFNSMCYFSTSLSDFPANMFDTTGALYTTALSNAFRRCALTAQSIENILTSLDTNGATNVTLGIQEGVNASYSTWSTAAQTALSNLQTKGWTISYNT